MVFCLLDYSYIDYILLIRKCQEKKSRLSSPQQAAGFSPVLYNARIEQLATDLPSAAIAKQLVQECIADLATYLDGWAGWMGGTDQDAEDRKRMLVQKIAELSETLEKLEHRTPALS